jgi:hypothetical protein
VHYASFTSETPLDHLQRLLDELRRGGFELCSLSLAPDGGAAAPAAAIRVGFAPGGPVACHTLLERLARLPGVRELDGGLPRLPESGGFA